MTGPASNGGSVERARLVVGCGALARPLLTRFVAALAAETSLAVDRVDEACHVAEAISDRCSELTPDGHVELAVVLRDDALEMRVGPLAAGAADELLQSDARQLEGGAIRGLASRVEVRRGRSGEETLRIIVGPRARAG